MDKQKQIRDINIEDLEQNCADLLMLSYTQLGQTPEQEQVLIMTKTLAQDLKMDFKSFTWEDCERAFRKGIRDGEEFHMKVPTFYKWLKRWRDIKWDAIYQERQGQDKMHIQYFAESEVIKKLKLNYQPKLLNKKNNYGKRN